MSPADIKRFCNLTNDAWAYLKTTIMQFNLSARLYFKTIKVAQTIADLSNKDVIEESDIAEALQYRIRDE